MVFKHKLSRRLALMRDLPRCIVAPAPAVACERAFALTNVAPPPPFAAYGRVLHAMMEQTP